jgi:hypothetical protein
LSKDCIATVVRAKLISSKKLSGSPTLSLSQWNFFPGFKNIFYKKEPKVETFFYIKKYKNKTKNILEAKIQQFLFISSTGSQSAQKCSPTHTWFLEKKKRITLLKLPLSLAPLKFFVVLKTKECNESNSFFISRNHRAMTTELNCQSVNNFQKSVFLCLCFNTAVDSK